MIKEYPVKFVTLRSGETLGYRQAGRGNKTLVLLHGNMSSSLFYDVLMERLEGEYSLYAVDMRGFGDSTYHKPVDSLDCFAQDIVAFADALNLTSFSVAGWSTGGGVALEVAASIPTRVEKVMLIASVGVKGYPMFRKDANGQPIMTERLTTREAIASDPVQVLPILHAYATGNRELLKVVWNALIYNRVQPAPERYDRYLDAMLKQRNLVDVDYALVMFNMTGESNGVTLGSSRLSLVTAPVLVIQGDSDLVIPPMWAAETVTALGPRAALAIMQGVGHSPLTDNLRELVSLVTGFLL